MTAAEMMAETLPPPPEPYIKICACGRPYTFEQWNELRPVGIQVVPQDEDGPETRYELRDCAKCSSTIAIEVTR